MGELTPCILHEGRLTDRGYAAAYIDGRHVRLHRHVYAECFGPIPKGYELHHMCGVRHCLNPEHLVALTRREHMALHYPVLALAMLAKTHCPKGHAYTPDNLVARPRRRSRECRACARERDRLRRAKAVLA